MSIESLHLKGFKSFGSPCSFTFNGGFTAIVGPNGSGKSNILDALRWILGEGSGTALRILRQSDLLFSGSISVPPAKGAEVRLVVTKGEDRAVLCRQYAEGGGTLLLDEERILLQDLDAVKERFSLSGEGFAFIGQGEVSAAIHQRPRERRRQLDLLFGVDRYRARRDETLKRLDDALSEARRIETLIQDLNDRRAEIAADVGVAVEARGILDNLEVLRRDFYFSKRLELERSGAALRSEAQLLRVRLDSEVRWRELWRRALLGAEEALRGQGFDERAFTERMEELAARKDTLQRQAFQSAARVRAILERRAVLLDEVRKDEERRDALRQELDSARGDVAEGERRLAGCREAIEARARELDESRAGVERERERRQRLRDELAERRLSASRAEAELRALAASDREGAVELERLHGEERCRAEAGAALERRVAEASARHGRLTDEHAVLYASCQKQAATLQQMRRDRARREGDLDSLRDSAGASVYPEPVRLLLSASRLNRMRSRPEVAAEAFSCPSGIAPALEAYLGGRQFWLLVRTLDEAQEGIELLKQRRAGRATYLPLERCRPRDRDARFRLPSTGVVGWAMDLIQVRSPWEPALLHMMGDLLIVEDFALGSSLAKQGARFPIATLDGEVFAPSGTVSGGRGRQRASAIVLNQQIAQAQEAIEELCRRIEEADGALRADEAREQELSTARDGAAAELERLRTDAAASARTLAALRASVERLEADRAQGAARAEELKADLRSSGARTKALEEELSGLNEIADEEGMEAALAPMRAELSLAEERLRGARAIAERMEGEYAALSGQVERLTEEAEAGRREEAERRTLLGGIGRERLTLHREEQALARRLEEERGRLRQAHFRLERLRARSSRADAAESGRQAEIAALEERLTAVGAERGQLMELWDEKYPYDAAEAREVEGGRDLIASLRKLERELKALGPYNLGALSEDTSLTERVDFLGDQLEDVRGGADELRELIRQTDAQVESTFVGAMAEIDARFNALFQRLFAGGEARLTLQEGTNIWERGVDIYARPPGKKLQNISQLSGGEQSLTAIAQLFAALEVAKVPLAVLDEVDAALDEYNLIRFADLAKEYSRSLQLIVMTHRRTTMERADLIYGVTMVEPGLSRIVGIDVESYR